MGDKNIAENKRKEKIEKDAKKLAENFVQFLKENKLLIQTLPPEKYQKIRERNGSIVYITSYMTPFQGGRFKKIKAEMYAKTNISKSLNELCFIHYVTLVTSLYDIFYNELSYWLDFGKLGFSTHDIKKYPPTYGITISKFKDLDPKILDVLDARMRNRLAHYDWVVENNMFCGYNPEIRHTDDEFLDKINLFELFYIETIALIRKEHIY